MEEVERRYVLVSLAFILAIAATLVVVDLVRGEPTLPPRVERTRTCLEVEERLTVLELPLGSPLTEARLGGLVTIVEQNTIRLGIAGSFAEAGALAERSRARGGFVEVDGDIVRDWDREPSATQRQPLIDCRY